MYTVTPDDRLIDRISPLFKDTASMQRWLQRELELIVIYHAGCSFSEWGKEQHTRLTRRIVSLSKLENGWDGQSALAPSSQALLHASTVIYFLPEDILSNCALFPSNDSSVFLQGRFPCGRLAAHFNGEVMNYVLKVQDGQTESKTVTIEAAEMQQFADTIQKQCLA